MNLLGKMFILLIFIMSITFMAFSVAIYATHTNWKKRSEEVAVKLKEAQTAAQQIAERRDDLLRQRDEELSKRAAAISTLTTKVEELDKENKQFRDELTQLNEQKEQGIAAVKLSHDSMVAARAEVEGLRKDLRKSQEEWAKLYSDLVAKTDEAHGLAMKLANYRSVGDKLAKDYRDAVDVLKQHGLKPEPELYSGVAPKGVHGIITEVRPNGWVEISIGEDSGIVKGQRLDVVRNIDGRSSYIGKIEIVRAEADRSAAVVLPEFRRGTVQQDDVVESIEVNELTAK
ncbi:hypothetical protein FACS1894214_1450 [Planctomycetales bacterium]|nr:hypothetical protein FACS1894214_1450 [Planctomycetales bacterium]